MFFSDCIGGSIIGGAVDSLVQSNAEVVLLGNGDAQSKGEAGGSDKSQGCRVLHR